MKGWVDGWMSWNSEPWNGAQVLSLTLDPSLFASCCLIVLLLLPWKLFTAVTLLCEFTSLRLSFLKCNMRR